MTSLSNLEQYNELIFPIIQSKILITPGLKKKSILVEQDTDGFNIRNRIIISSNESDAIIKALLMTLPEWIKFFDTNCYAIIKNLRYGNTCCDSYEIYKENPILNSFKNSLKEIIGENNYPFVKVEQSDNEIGISNFTNLYYDKGYINIIVSSGNEYLVSITDLLLTFSETELKELMRILIPSNEYTFDYDVETW